MADGMPRAAAHAIVSTAALLDVNGGRGYLGNDIVRRAGRQTVGRALTVRTGRGDNLALHRAVAAARPGDVVVVSCPGPFAGLAGEVICTALQALGADGFVTDSGVRDHDELVRIGLPVWSAALTPMGTTKADHGTVGQPIEIGGVRVATGDVVVGDGDGVVCVPQDEWPPLREAATSKQTVEHAWLMELRRGTHLGALTDLVDD